MTDEEVDRVLKEASEATPRVRIELIESIAGSLNSSLQPVRPLPPPWVLTAGLVVICAAVAVIAAARLGFYGIEKLTPWERILIFSILAMLLCVSARELVSQLIPGSRQQFGVGGLLITLGASLLGVFSLAFRGYDPDHFFSAGIACLLSGVLVAVPASFLCWLLLRRGFAVNPIAAGLIGGAVSSLCGVTMLELHCANLQALHVIAWHTGVIPVGAAMGALLAWTCSNRPSGGGG